MASTDKSSQFKLDHLVDVYAKNVAKFQDEKFIDLEFEVRFGKPERENMNKYDKEHVINKNKFDDVFKALRKYGFTTTSSKYMLRTVMEYDTQKGEKRDSNVRIEIEDLESIKNLCETSSLPDMNKLGFTEKVFVDDIKGPIYNNDYVYRVSIQKEKSFSKSSNIAKSMVVEWPSQRKKFRYIHRTTLIHSSMPHIQVDMSSVKANYGNKQVKFKDTDLLNQPFTYEIEIETRNVRRGINFDNLKSDLKRTIKYVLCGIQNTHSIPMKIKTTYNVLNNYFDILATHNHGEEVRRTKKSSNFIGPSSYTLLRENVIKSDENSAINIQNGFGVTDKADGDRKMLFIDKTGHMYFIDTNMNITYTGSRIKSKKILNTIIDGEHIMYDKYNNVINLYAAFDIYVIGNQEYRDKKFYLSEEEKKDLKYEDFTRYDILAIVIKKLNEAMEYDIPKSKLNLSVKEFIFEDKKNNVSIFNCCWTLLNKIQTNNYIYNTDGLIFTSKYLGVTQEHEKDDIKNRKHTWGHSFKWKPPEYNTIDFLVEVQKDNIGKPIKKTKLVGSDIQSYYEIYLKVGFDENHDQHGYLNAQKRILTMQYIKMRTRDYRINDKYHPENFQPTNPSNENAYICHVPLSTHNGSDAMITEEGDLMEDDSIVEFRYDINSEDTFMSWKPLRVRFDKTSGYQTHKSNFGNAYHVANSNWQSIHNPVTERMLTDESYLSEYMLQDNDDDVYYNNGNKTNSVTMPLRHFHNIYVKAKIINIVASKFSKPKLLDLAVGMGGDLDKWVASKIYALLGIDLSKDNIHNNLKGACARYLKKYKSTPNIPIAMFIEGDSSKLLSNGEFAEGVNDYKENGITLDDVEKRQVESLSYTTLKALTGVGRKEDQKVPFLKERFGIFSDKFDITSIQFALHYMFRDQVSLHNFLRNICEYTKVGGYFIGTCYSGERVYEELKELKQGERLEKYKNNKKIWHVAKGYDDDDLEFLENDERSLGYTITVYQESINKEFDEYLVNFTYFVKMMELYGFILEKNETLDNKNINTLGSFGELFEIFKHDKNKKNYKSAWKISNEEKYISFLNNYFIFRKKHDANAEMVYDYHINKMDTDDVKTDFNISRAQRTDKVIVLES
jgi:hypothetical protein